MIPFSELKVDALLVSGLPNIRYLTGFTGDNAQLLITPGSQTLFTDPRYTIQASEECTCPVKIHSKGPLDQAVADSIRRKKLKRIGFEASRIIYDVYLRLKQALPLGATLKPLARRGRKAAHGQIGRRDRTHPPQRPHEFEGSRKNRPFHSPRHLGGWARSRTGIPDAALGR